MAAMRERRHEAQPSGIKTFGSTFKNPEDERAEGRTAGPAARGGRLPRAAGRRRPLLREARELRREHRRGDDRRRARADGRGPPPGPRALRRRARARGADCSATCAGRRAGSCEQAGRLGESPAGLVARSPCWPARCLLVRRARHDRRSARCVPPRATATIGSGRGAIAVGPDGRVLDWLPLPEGTRLPQLPLAEPPRTAASPGRCCSRRGSSARRPPTLRPYLASSSYGESGVDVELRSGIELRFGDAFAPAEKWRAAAAVLADPSITALDYVDLHAPGRPAVGGSGHTLPPPP